MDNKKIAEMFERIYRKGYMDALESCEKYGLIAVKKSVDEVLDEAFEKTRKQFNIQ